MEFCMRKTFLFLAIIFIIIGLCSCNNKEKNNIIIITTAPTIQTTTQTTTSKSTLYTSIISDIKFNALGIYQGNFINYGVAAYSNGWIYCLYNNKLYKIKNDNSSKILLSNDKPKSINIVGSWVYYTINDDFDYNPNMNNYIYRISLDGKNKQTITQLDKKAFPVFFVSDNFIYFTKVNEIKEGTRLLMVNIFAKLYKLI